MRFRRLCKAGDSIDPTNECPAVYLAEGDLTCMIAQGKVLDATTLAGLLDVALDESAVRLPTETVLRAAGLFLAEQGRPDLRDAIDEVLARLGLLAATR